MDWRILQARKNQLSSGRNKEPVLPLAVQTHGTHTIERMSVPAATPTRRIFYTQTGVCVVDTERVRDTLIAGFS